MDLLLTGSPLLLIGGLILAILLSILSWWISKRKKTIDQFESDARILLVFLIIISFYLLFLCVSVTYAVAFISTSKFEYLMISLYLLFPPFLGILLYVLLPWLWGRHLHLRESLPSDTVKEIAHLLNLPVPAVMTTPLEVPPLVFGRSGRQSIFVLPENMESLLTDKEQKAVIVHELSHIKQGDVGFFTWLTLLTRGFMYWVLPFPFILLSGFGNLYNFILKTGFFIFFFVPFFILILIFLKNSLSRTRESISDAYVIFYGFQTPLKSALYKYAVKRTSQPGNALNFYRSPKFLKSLLSTHPSIQKRFHDIDKKTFLREDITNLPWELAFWTGIASACLSYNILNSAIGFSATFGFPLTAEPIFEIFFTFMVCTVASAVAIPYIFPTTKAPLFLSDVGRRDFLFPLLRNWVITLVAAVGIYHVSSLDIERTIILVVEVFTGYIVWSMVFAVSRPSHFRHGNWYLLFAPIVWCILLWVPVRTIYSFFSGFPINIDQLARSMLGVLLLTIAITLVLTARGQMYMEREERSVVLFGKRNEYNNDLSFVFMVLFGMFLIPAMAALGVYTVSCLFDLFEIIPIKMSLLFGIASVLLIYGRKKSDILYFTELHFLTDIISWKSDKFHSQFIQKVIETYQSPDGGFDHAGHRFSNQKDTFYVIKTAKTLKIPIKEERIKDWINSTEIKTGGFALFSGGYPRIEGLYYATQSLSLMEMQGKISDIHVQWVLDSFTGECFTFRNDTCSLLLQTCYAVESLFLMHTLPEELSSCRKWIEIHIHRGIKPKEAFFAARALKILHSDRKPLYNWLVTTQYVLTTRVDKNLEDIYYYVSVLHEMKEPIPSLIEEQVFRCLEKDQRKYRKRFY